ncbi:hypothetical protein D3C72_2447320 [compost metagenome]
MALIQRRQRGKVENKQMGKRMHRCRRTTNILHHGFTPCTVEETGQMILMGGLLFFRAQGDALSELTMIRRG